MNKPWEETWTAEPGDWHVYNELGHDENEVIFDRSTRREARSASMEEKARARLAACAPEAIRMLLAMEWAGVTIDGEDENVAVYRGACLACGNDSMLGHNPKCPWLALMRKAGVRE